MPGTWTTLSVKDAGGTSRTMRVWDESGAGTGPFAFGGVIGDGSGSANAIGEVQASPTSNTALDRLKQIQGNSFAKGTPGVPSSDVVSTQYADLRTATTNIAVSDAGSSSTTGQNGAAIITGTPNAGSFASWAVNGSALTRIQLSGTWAATIAIEGSADGGTTWGTKTALVSGTAPTSTVTSVTGNGQFDVDSAGLTNVRVRCTAFTSGTAVAQANITSVSGAVPGLTSTSSTGTETNVASSATDVTILASNTSRKGAAVFNDSTATLYLLLSSGTSTTSLYSVQLGPGGYYEVPYGYTGVIKGLWSSATGNARVTEFT